MQAEEPRLAVEIESFELMPTTAGAIAFDAFCREHFRRVAVLAYGLSGSRSAAEELAQEAFAAAHARWPRVQSLVDPGAWVRRIAMNKARSAFRRRQAELHALARFKAQRQLPAELPAEHDVFWRAVRSLPSRQAMAVALHYADNRSIEEIAVVLECSPGTVKTHLHRARLTLRDRLPRKDADG